MAALSNRARIAEGVTVGVLVLVAGCIAFMRAYDLGDRPTCFSLKVEGKSETVGTILDAFSDSAALAKKQRTATSIRASNGELFLKWDQDGMSSSVVFLCAQQRGDAKWQDSVKVLEAALGSKARIAAAQLQRGSDYACERACDFRHCSDPCSQSVALPIDMETLTQRGTLRR